MLLKIWLFFCSLLFKLNSNTVGKHFWVNDGKLPGKIRFIEYISIVFFWKIGTELPCVKHSYFCVLLKYVWISKPAQGSLFLQHAVNLFVD